MKIVSDEEIERLISKTVNELLKTNSKVTHNCYENAVSKAKKAYGEDISPCYEALFVEAIQSGAVLGALTAIKILADTGVLPTRKLAD